MANRCGTPNTLTIGQADPECGCTADGVVKATPIITSGAPSVAPQDCEPNIAYDVTGEDIYFYYNAAWHKFDALGSIPALNLCSLEEAAVIVAGDTLAGCFQSATKKVTIDDLKDYILDLCDLPDLTAQVATGNTTIAACVSGNSGTINPSAPICAATNTGDIDGGDEIIVCSGGDIAKKTYVDPDPCLKPQTGTLAEGDSIVTCCAGGIERKVYEEPNPCDATLTGELGDGDVILACGASGVERKTYSEPDLCGSTDGGSLQSTDRVLTCRNGNIVRAQVVSGEACNTRIRAEDNDPLIEVTEESACGECCGFVISSKDVEPPARCDICTDEPGYNIDADAPIDDHLQAISDEFCWVRQNLVRFTNTPSPSEIASNHPAYKWYVSPSGVDAPCRGTLAEPFATPAYALRMLDQYRIPSNIPAGVFIGAGDYDLTEPIAFGHPDGGNIRIIGDGSGVTNLNFTGSRGFVVTRGHLDLLTGVTLNGDGTSEGVYVANTSNLTMTDSVINNFQYGVRAVRNSTFYSNNVAITNNTVWGVSAAATGKAFLIGGSVTGSGSNGASARDSGRIYTETTTPPTFSGNALGDYSPAFGVIGNNDALITDFAA